MWGKFKRVAPQLLVKTMNLQEGQTVDYLENDKSYTVREVDEHQEEVLLLREQDGDYQRANFDQVVN